MQSDFCIVAPAMAYDPASGLPVKAARAVPADARCPVCGMFPARAPRWATQIIFANGDAQFLESPGSLFAYLQRVAPAAMGQAGTTVAAAYVTDLLTGRWVPAWQAVYVEGSSETGPMRSANYPAFADEASARRFVQQSGGMLVSAYAVARRLRQRVSLSERHPVH